MFDIVQGDVCRSLFENRDQTDNTPSFIFVIIKQHFSFSINLYNTLCSFKRNSILKRD